MITSKDLKEEDFIPTDEDRQYFKELEEAEELEYNITKLVKGNFVYFDSFRQGFFMYTLVTEEGTFQFPVPLDDIGTATMLQRDKALTFMRWIRKAISDKTLIRI